MNIIYIVFFTLIGYSIISTVFYIISKENDKILIAFGLGVFGITLYVISEIAYKVSNKFKYHIGKRSIFEDVNTGNKYKCKVKDANDIDGWISDYRIIKRYATKDEWFGIPDFSKEFIENSKINCSHCKHDNVNECICNFPYEDRVKCRHDKFGTILEFNKFESK